MEKLKDKFFANYKSRVEKFVDMVKDLPEDELAKIPMPFLPLYGDLYENCPLKIVFAGIETRGWGNTATFVKDASQKSSKVLMSEADSFRKHEFTKWGNNFGNAFWDVVMFFISEMYGIEDWKEIKKEQHPNILSSFVWANSNSIEKYETTATQNNCDFEVWKTVKEASKVFDSGQLLVNTFKPDVLVLFSKNLSVSDYFGEDCKLVEFDSDDSGYKVFRVPSCECFVIQMPHPTNMRLSDKDKEFYRNLFIGTLEETGLKARLFQKDYSIEKYIKQYFNSAMDKYEFVAWVANLICQRDEEMTARKLASLLNDCGYRTDRGTQFSQKGKGPYQIIKTAYKHYERAEDVITKGRIAQAFVSEYGDHVWER